MNIPANSRLYNLLRCLKCCEFCYSSASLHHNREAGWFYFTTEKQQCAKNRSVPRGRSGACVEEILLFRFSSSSPETSASLKPEASLLLHLPSRTVQVPQQFLGELQNRFSIIKSSFLRAFESKSWSSSR